MASRRRSACPLWRAYSSTRCCHIQRTEVVFSRNVNRVVQLQRPPARHRRPGTQPGSARSPPRRRPGLPLRSPRPGHRNGSTGRVPAHRRKSLPDPPALGVAHVPDQAEQREVRRRHGAPGQLGGIQARAFAQQGGPVPVEPVAEHLPLGFVAARRIVLRTLDVGCDPGHGGSLCLGFADAQHSGQKGSRPMKPSSLVWVSASSGTSTRAPYWPEERITCSICSIPPRS